MPSGSFLRGAFRHYTDIMPIRINRREFQELVREALTDLPDEFARAMKNVAVVVEEEPTAEELESLGSTFAGRPLRPLPGSAAPERGARRPRAPRRIAIYRLPILWACETRAEAVAEVRTTVIHELGHYFGLDEDELPP